MPGLMTRKILAIALLCSAAILAHGCSTEPDVPEATREVSSQLNIFPTYDCRQCTCRWNGSAYVQPCSWGALSQCTVFTAIRVDYCWGGSSSPSACSPATVNFYGNGFWCFENP
jgi:hypothetical protein